MFFLFSRKYSARGEAGLVLLPFRSVSLLNLIFFTETCILVKHKAWLDPSTHPLCLLLGSAGLGALVRVMEPAPEWPHLALRPKRSGPAQRGIFGSSSKRELYIVGSELRRRCRAAKSAKGFQEHVHTAPPFALPATSSRPK